MNPQIAVYRRMTINRHWRDSKVTTATRATCEALRWGRAMLCRDLDIRTQPYKLCFVPKSKSFYGWAILPSWKGLKWSKMQFFSPFFWVDLIRSHGLYVYQASTNLWHTPQESEPCTSEFCHLDLNCNLPEHQDFTTKMRKFETWKDDERYLKDDEREK